VNLIMQGSRVAVLLVEDNPADVRLFREALTGHGSNIALTVVNNGEDALRYVRRQKPYADAGPVDIIILDLNLPRKDGREVLAELKADPQFRSTPVVVLTTSGAENDIRRAYDLHANCYIRKPVDVSQFMQVLQSWKTFWVGVARLPVH
jgi:two-component system, chemotaxis family, response regulator Rcp1